LEDKRGVRANSLEPTLPTDLNRLVSCPAYFCAKKGRARDYESLPHMKWSNLVVLDLVV